MKLHKQIITSKIIPKFIKCKVPDTRLKSFDIKQIDGDSFMLTKCYKVHVAVEKPVDRELQNFWLFAKFTPECEPDMYDLIQFHNLFMNEIIAYTRIIPLFDKHKKYVKLRDSEVQRASSYIVLDDFASRGWRLAKEMVNLSLEHIYVAMHELATFHGKFYALKIQNIDKFLEIVGMLHESRYNRNQVNEDYHAACVAGCKRAVDCVRKSALKDEIPESFLTKLANLIKDPHKYGRQIVRPQEPLSTLCHGDYLRNNIAFRYASDNDGNEIPIEAMMFDLQTMRHSSPMLDVCVFICNSTGIDVRGPNFDKIFDAYFNTLIETIKQDVDGELPEYFNRNRFLKEYVRNLPMGLSIAAPFLPLLFNKGDLVVDFVNPVGPEEMARRSLTLGGEAVDRELRSIVHEMYKLSNELNVDIFSI